MDLKPSPALKRKAFALLGEARIGGKADRPARLKFYEYITWRKVESSNELTAADYAAVVNTLEYWKSCGEIEYRCRQVAGGIQEVS